ncbi:hypothetical protein CSKR_112112 [Clonorchis sinensis]|uniref:Uncharacterized protein n=1 Tax=Clonorchis sinensis TaxID=79923 RepID=A0A419PCE4_CLOSI|nr:hypothetical protein CSKR_112112 [Clonorchis sinensis]
MNTDYLPWCPSYSRATELQLGEDISTCRCCFFYRQGLLSLSISSANLLTGRSVIRIRPLLLDLPCLGLDNLAVPQPSRFLLVAWQLGAERVVQLDDYFFIIICIPNNSLPTKETGNKKVRSAI